MLSKTSSMLSGCSRAWGRLQSPMQGCPQTFPNLATPLARQLAHHKQEMHGEFHSAGRSLAVHTNIGDTPAKLPTE